LVNALTTFDNSHAGWSYSWAGIAAEQKVESALSVKSDQAWAGEQPAVVAANGANYAVKPSLANSNANENDVGGAVLSLDFNVATANTALGGNGLNLGSVDNGNGTTTTTSLNWVQALQAHHDTPAYANPNPYYQYRLDNPYATNGTPFYNDGGAAGTYNAGANAYFFDRPWKVENEASESNPVADVQFQVALAMDAQTTNNTTGAVISNVLTLYGGYWWGYTYTAQEVAGFAAPAAGTFATGEASVNEDSVAVSNIRQPTTTRHSRRRSTRSRSRFPSRRRWRSC
jgi:hypothetical protein